MTTSILTEVIPQERLHEIYATEYYWYLKSEPFVNAFLRPLANEVNSRGASCLDVCCGEGQLSPLIDGRYMGIDASETAIQLARIKHNRAFSVATLETYATDGKEPPNFDTVVFGGVFQVLIKPDRYVELLERYLAFAPKQFVIYDMEHLDASSIDARFKLVHEHHATVDMPTVQDVKRSRKVLVYEC